MFLIVVLRNGIPQGSMLGPTLFLIYTNTLWQLRLDSGHLLASGDDTALVFQEFSWVKSTGSYRKGIHGCYELVEKEFAYH